MISVEEALEYIRKNTTCTRNTEVRQVVQSVGYVLSEDILSSINMPPFRQSAMDGYALWLHDNLEYSLIDEVKAGDSHHPVLKEGDAVRIFTGAPVPDTANAVIRQEIVNNHGSSISIENQVPVGNNIRPLGEQVMKGMLALKKGVVMTPASVGYLTSLGITDVMVYKKPSIGIVVTGSELIKAGNDLPIGKIYESNSGMLQTALNSTGYTDSTIYKVADDYAGTLSKLERVLSKHDVVIITGGISVGDYDFVGTALDELSVDQLFYKVRQKPGKPLYFGKKGDVIVFALPGNPAAVLTCFYVYVHQVLQKISGIEPLSEQKGKIISASEYVNKGERALFLKAILKDGEVHILEGQNSSMLHTFSLANALIYLPAEKNKIEIGDDVEVVKLPL